MDQDETISDQANRILIRRIVEKTFKSLVEEVDLEAPSWSSRYADRPSVRACLPPKLLVSQMLQEYQRINAARLATKSPQQLWKWRVARQTSVEIFIKAIGGDCPLDLLDLKYTHRFHSYWQQRVLDGDFRIHSANRLMRNISGLYSSIHAFYQLDRKNPFLGLHVRGGREGQRLPYASEFIQQRLLADGTFDCLNAEARRIIFLMIETGLRPSEACALNATTIHLNSPIPYVRVTDDGRETKTPGSLRSIPLVGVALLAMRQQPDGFPRYRNRADTASATINKVLKEKDLKPGGRLQTLYSLRHSLVDRLRAAEAPKDIQEDILGHVHLYGEGTTLEHRQAWLRRIAFAAPAQV